MNWLQQKLFKLKTGAGIEVVNKGKPVDELVIKYKDTYFGIMMDVKTQEPTGHFAWSKDYGSFPSTPVREFWTATPPKSNQENK